MSKGSKRLGDALKALAELGFEKFPEQQNRGNLSLSCEKCGHLILTGITPTTNLHKLAKAWWPWKGCKCYVDTLKLDFRGPGLFGFVPEYK